MNKHDFPEGTRVNAEYYQDGQRYDGVIVNNLSVMYFIKFDNGQEEFVFKAQDVRILEEQ